MGGGVNIQKDRVTFLITEDENNLIRELASTQGVTKTEAFRSAIRLYYLLTKECGDKGELIIRKGGVNGMEKTVWISKV